MTSCSLPRSPRSVQAIVSVPNAAGSDSGIFSFFRTLGSRCLLGRSDGTTGKSICLGANEGCGRLMTSCSLPRSPRSVQLSLYLMRQDLTQEVCSFVLWVGGACWQKRWDNREKHLPRGEQVSVFSFAGCGRLMTSCSLPRSPRSAQEIVSVPNAAGSDSGIFSFFRALGSKRNLRVCRPPQSVLRP